MTYLLGSQLYLSYTQTKSVEMGHCVAAVERCPFPIPDELLPLQRRGRVRTEEEAAVAAFKFNSCYFYVRQIRWRCRCWCLKNKFYSAKEEHKRSIIICLFCWLRSEDHVHSYWPDRTRESWLMDPPVQWLCADLSISLWAVTWGGPATTGE